MIITEEDIKFIDFAYGCINRAHYPSSNQTVDTYNKVFADRPNFRKRAYTSCGSCIRNMVLEMKREKDKLVKKFEEENNIKMEKKEDGNKHTEGSPAGRSDVRPSERNEQIPSTEEVAGKTV